VNDVDDFNEEWILDNVETYPLLSTEPLQLTYDVTQELDITFDEDNDEDVSYYIDDIDTEFHSLQSLEDWIAESINDCDYTAEQCKSWDIEKRIKTRVVVEIEGDDEFDVTAYGARRTVSDFIDTPKPTPMDIDYSTLTTAELVAIADELSQLIDSRDETIAQMIGEDEIEVDTADHVVALGHPDTIERGAKIWALSEFYANQRLKADKPVYLIDEVGRGVRTESLEAIREYVRQGGMVGRLWNEEDWHNE
jgi:hypothetical protein